MNEPSEIKFLKAKVALLETEKKHLTQKLASLGKQKTNKPPLQLIPPVDSKEYDIGFPVEQKIQLLMLGLVH